MRCLLADLSKAMEHVDHVVLAEKLSRLQLPECVFTWLISFLTGRSYAINKVGALALNLSLCQEILVFFSVFWLEPTTFYIILESDIKPVSNMNVTSKQRWAVTRYM